MGQASALSEMAGIEESSEVRGTLVPVDPEVLSDLRHSLGNYFHKLYYWADYLKSGADDLGPDVVPAEMIDQTLQGLEGFLKVALEYFRQPELSPVTLNGEELGRTLASVLRTGQASRAEVSIGAKVERWRVAIDPSRFSEAVTIAARQVRAVAGPEGAVLRGSVQVAPGGRLRLELDRADAEATRAARDPSVVEWAVAERMLAAQGSSLEAVRPSGVLLGCVIHVPAQAA